MSRDLEDFGRRDRETRGKFNESGKSETVESQRTAPGCRRCEFTSRKRKRVAKRGSRPSGETAMCRNTHRPSAMFSYSTAASGSTAVACSSTGCGGGGAREAARMTHYATAARSSTQHAAHTCICTLVHAHAQLGTSWHMHMYVSRCWFVRFGTTTPRESR